MLFQNFLITDKKNCNHEAITPRPLCPQALDTSNLLCLYTFVILAVSYRWNHIIFVLLYVDLFTYIMFSRLIHVAVYSRISFRLQMSNIHWMWTHLLLIHASVGVPLCGFHLLPIVNLYSARVSFKPWIYIEFYKCLFASTEMIMCIYSFLHWWITF